MAGSFRHRPLLGNEILAPFSRPPLVRSLNSLDICVQLPEHLRMFDPEYAEEKESPIISSVWCAGALTFDRLAHHLQWSRPENDRWF